MMSATDEAQRPLSPLPEPTEASAKTTEEAQRPLSPRATTAPDATEATEAQGSRSVVPADDDDSDSEISIPPVAPAPRAKKKRRIIEAKTSSVLMTESARFKRDDARCAARLERREAQAHEAVHDESLVGDADAETFLRFGGYDGFSNPAKIKRGC